jgi:uncharacterized repeat protein (TIGR03837 family)
VPTLHLSRVPWVAQADFDRLLWCAELNFVRGEDSFVSAIWAARPFIWHLYPQAQQLHLQKLQAWLANYPAPAQVSAAIRAWNQGDQCNAIASNLAASLTEPVWTDWQHAAGTWSAEQALSPDLADKLADFCEKLAQKG